MRRARPFVTPANGWIVDLVREVARVSAALAATSSYGLYHRTSQGETTWAAFASLAAEILGMPATKVEAVPTAASPMQRRLPGRGAPSSSQSTAPRDRARQLVRLGRTPCGLSRPKRASRPRCPRRPRRRHANRTASRASHIVALKSFQDAPRLLLREATGDSGVPWVRDSGAGTCRPPSATVLRGLHYHLKQADFWIVPSWPGPRGAL